MPLQVRNSADFYSGFDTLSPDFQIITTMVPRISTDREATCLPCSPAARFFSGHVVDEEDFMELAAYFNEDDDRDIVPNDVLGFLV